MQQVKLFGWTATVENGGLIDSGTKLCYSHKDAAMLVLRELSRLASTKDIPEGEYTVVTYESAVLNKYLWQDNDFVPEIDMDPKYQWTLIREKGENDWGRCKDQTEGITLADQALRDNGWILL